MKGIRRTKTKAIVSVAALEFFTAEFCPKEMIASLVELCEFATTHPDFGKPGQPGGGEYDWADQATDVLSELFNDENAVDPNEADRSRFEVNPKDGTIVITFWHARQKKRRRRRAVPSLEHATEGIRLSLTHRHGARN